MPDVPKPDRTVAAAIVAMKVFMGRTLARAAERSLSVH
jgi:hypothetical protein